MLEVRNPYNNEIVSATFLATEKDVNDAIQAAVQAFEETRKLPSYKRAGILGNISRKWFDAGYLRLGVMQPL